MSQHVKRLEQAIGVCLLERRPRGVVPTAEGLVLRQAATDSIVGLDQALRRLTELARDGVGSVRITTGAITVRHFMSEAVIAFRRRHPAASLELRTKTSSRTCFESLAAGTVDLAWVTIIAPLRGIEQRPVVELPWVVAVRADDPFARRSALTAADLARLRPILPPENSSSRAHLNASLARLNVTPGPDSGTADWDSAVLLAELGIGHALVPALPGWQSVDVANTPLRFLPVPELPPLVVGWAVRQWETLGPLAREFAETVVRHCEAR
ncbi:LysR family transcriptional regulator [Nocardia sp. NPDC051570]|uniref:LysR family transcriptional regulator n=1 Tax=Nocardia sp. NPDC051570 TaxID=3364324 RepID=UPI0037A32BBF